MYIKKLKAKHFKKYKNLEVDFNENINLLIGENESGKSTILQAIDLLLSGSRNKVETIGLEYLFNKNVIKDFFNNKKYENLPKLEIEIFFDNVDDDSYWGKNNSLNTNLFGILLICKPNEDLSKEIKDILEQEDDNFPFEFYNINFYKFGGNPYMGFTRKFKHILLDHSNINNDYATNQYIKTLYSASVNTTNKQIQSNEYRKLKKQFKDLILIDINKNVPEKKYEFSLKSHSKSSLENDLTIVENEIDIIHRGKGRQCFIKTEYALSKNENELDFILLEEPENHLSHLNMHLLIDRINLSKNKQLFITTHNNLISSRLDLRNAIFVNSSDINIDLSNLTNETANFFIKAPNKNLLEFILSKKVALVEGDAEFILLENFFERIYKNKPYNFGINIISVGGTSFKRYLEISNLLKIKTAVIRDNDKDYQKNCVNNYVEFLSEFSQIFFEKDNEINTFEISLYSLNKDLCDEAFSPKLRTRTVQEYMLSEKTEAAYSLLLKDSEIIIPEYIKSAFEWLIKD